MSKYEAQHKYQTTIKYHKLQWPIIESFFTSLGKSHLLLGGGGGAGYIFMW